MEQGNKKPANRFRLRVTWNFLEAPGLNNGAEGEIRTRTGVAYYPLKIACLPIPPLRLCPTYLLERSGGMSCGVAD